MTKAIEFPLVTTPSNPFGDERRKLSQQLQLRGHHLGRRQARRLCRNFALVGVDIPPRRLQQLVTGSPAAEREMTDVNFALIATAFNREKHSAKVNRLQRRCRHALLCAGLVLVSLNFLVCCAYVLFTLAHQT